MDKITNHSEREVGFLIPYLREYSGIKEIAQVNGDRWQKIEDCIWYIVSNQNIDFAKNFWLDLIGAKAGQYRQVYTPNPNGFLFDNEDRGFDNGLLMDSVSSSKSLTTLQDDIYRQFIKTAFIKNNYKAKRSIIINAIKILTGANKVWIYKEDNLLASVYIDVNIPDEYLDIYKEMIQSLMPQCVELLNLSTGFPKLFIDNEGKMLIDSNNNVIQGVEL